MRTILKLLLQVLLLPSTVAFGQIQMHGQGTSSWSFGVGDNTPNCTVASCWKDYSGGSFVRVIPTGGHVVGIDSSGCGWLYSDPISGGNNQWTKQTAWGCGLVAAFYAPNGNIYGQMTAMCDSSHHWISKFNGSTWAHTLACGQVSFDPAETSTSVAIGSDNKLYVSTTYYSTPATGVNGCEGSGGGALSVAMLGGSVFAVICLDKTVWFGSWGGGTTVNYTQLSPGLGTKVTGAGPTVWIIGTDGNPYRWRLDQDTGWKKFIGPGSALTDIGYGGIYNLWSVASNAPDRMTEWGIAANNTWNTSTVCTLNGQRTTCPSHSSQPPVQHTTTQIWHWQLNGVHKQGGSASVGPYDPSISQLVNTVGILDDPVGCNLDFVNCVIAEDSGELDCSQDGELAAVPPVAVPIPHVKNATTHSRRASGPPGAFGHLGWFSYPVSAECTAPPVWNPIEIVADSDNPNAFDSSAVCISWGSGPYVCYELAPYPPQWGVAIAEYGGTSKQGQPNPVDPGPQDCTQ